MHSLILLCVLTNLSMNYLLLSHVSVLTPYLYFNMIRVQTSDQQAFQFGVGREALGPPHPEPAGDRWPHTALPTRGCSFHVLSAERWLKPCTHAIPSPAWSRARQRRWSTLRPWFATRLSNLTSCAHPQPRLWDMRWRVRIICDYRVIRIHKKGCF